MSKQIIFATLVALLVSTIIPVISVEAQFSPPVTVVMQMKVLTANGADRGFSCQTNSTETRYGCTFFDSEAGYGSPYSGNPRPYPYSSNPVTVNIENDYLLDVVPQEMSPALYSQPAALRSQAVVARSYLHWQIGNSTIALNNSTQFQAFIPYSFEGLTLNSTFTPNDATLPCNSTNLDALQITLCSANSPRHYLAQDDGNPNALPAKALFFADVKNQTVDGTSDRPYLASVNEAISTACDADNFGPGYGLSQEGANRWARGHQCSYSGAPVVGNNAPGGPWSVRWTKPEQILFHYYKDVNLRDAGNNNAILSTSPQFRWNPLELINVPDVFTTTSPLPPLPYGFGLWVQNTGTISWSCISQSSGNPKSNRIRTQVIAVPSGVVLTSAITNFCTNATANPGERWSFNGAAVYIPAYCGDAKLVYDLGVVTDVSGATTYGSTNGWGVYERPIVLRTAPCKNYLPIVQKD